LFTPVKVGQMNLRHRIVFPAMSRLRAHWPTNVPSDLMHEYYTQRATDGGLMIAESNAVSQQGRAYHTGPGLYTDDQAQGWKRVTDSVHDKGGYFFAQLSHAGRVTSTANTNGADVVAPSVDPTLWANESIVVSTADGFTLPSPHRELQTGEIPTVVDHFRAAAENAKTAGFDGVELQACNAHLIEQFLHDSVNKRSDQYGGSIENRARFLMEIIAATTEVWGGDRIGVRISPSSVFGQIGDSDPHSLYGHLAERLNDFDIAYLHVIEPRISGGDTVDDAQGPVATDELRNIFHGPIIAAGGFHPDTAEAAVVNGTATLVSFGRHFTSNPDLPTRIQSDLPLTKYDRSTFYAFDAKGYTDFPRYNQ
jgi:N-ethylmaleimide reductase